MNSQAFVVIVEYDGEIDLQATADDMKEVLEASGFTVQNVNPWGNEETDAPVATNTMQALQSILPALQQDPEANQLQ